MAGLYIHIPFCKQACHYCNFHFSTSLRYKAEVVEAISKEIEMRSAFLPTKSLSSIYFGGGTPSLLNHAELSTIMEGIRKIYDIPHDCEITLEANPDDITPDKAVELIESGINRISIGVQSFFDEDLIFMTRAHSGGESHVAIQTLLEAGFTNMTADLIYGYPLLSEEKLAINIDALINYGINHISAYALTVESKTALFHQVKNNTWKPMDDALVATQFSYIEDKLRSAGYDHYEVSNYGRPGAYAIHNTNYWNDTPYLGIGPSAHSYDGQHRYWNISHNQKYLTAISADELAFTKESLSKYDRYNEYIMTSLRTKWGVNKERLRSSHSDLADYFIRESASYIEEGKMIVTEDHYTLSKDSLLFADQIASELFYIES